MTAVVSNQPTLDRFASFMRVNSPEEVLAPSPQTEIETLNQAILAQLYFACKNNAEQAARQYNISAQLAQQIASTQLAKLSSLASSAVLLFRPVCDDSVFVSAIRSELEQDDPIASIKLLAANFTHQRRAPKG